MSEQLKFVEEVEAAAQRAPQALYRDNLEGEEDARVATFEQTHTDGDGVLTVSQAAITEYRVEVRAALQRRASAYVTELANVQKAAVEALTVAEAVHAELPTEAQRLGPNADDHLRLMARSVDVQEADAAVRRLAGRTFGQIADVYEKTPDSSTDAALVRTIETGVRDGFHGIDVARTGADDAFAVARLQRLVAERRKARLPDWLKDARARVEKAVPATLRSHAAIVKAGVLIPKR